MRAPLFNEGQTPTEVRAAIADAGPLLVDELHPSDRAPLGTGKLRLVGIYDDRFDGTFMLRTRVPGGRLSVEQLEALAGIARDFAFKVPGVDEADHFVEITTRQDIQTHWIRFENLEELWNRYDAVGLSSLEACGNSVRNITSCPVDGIDPRGHIEVGPIIDAVSDFAMANERLSAFLPRKFKIAITGCPSDCLVARVNCIAFTPARRDGKIGFHVHVGGGLSDYPRLATELDLFVEAHQVVPIVRATLELYCAEGDFEHSSVNRFRALVHQLGPERVTAELRERVSFEIPSGGEGLSTWKVEDHIGVHADRFGSHFVGLCVPVGRLTADELFELAELSRRYGDGGIRLTQRQNLVLTGVKEVDRLLDEPIIARLQPAPDPFERALIACTSAPFCKFGILAMKPLGRELVAHLRERVPEEGWHRLEGLRMHLSGCKAACAQVPLSHIGLRATMAKDTDTFHDACDIAVGGDSGIGRIAKWADNDVPVEEAFDRITATLSAVARGEAELTDLDVATFEHLGGVTR